MISQIKNLYIAAKVIENSQRHKRSRSVEGQKYDAIVLGVAHKEFMALDYTSLRKENSVVYDVKGVLGNNVDGKL